MSSTVTRAAGRTGRVMPRRSTTGVRRLVRRLEHERSKWGRGAAPVCATEQAWRAGVSEGLRLAQLAIRKGV